MKVTYKFYTLTILNNKLQFFIICYNSLQFATLLYNLLQFVFLLQQQNLRFMTFESLICDV